MNVDQNELSQLADRLAQRLRTIPHHLDARDRAVLEEYDLLVGRVPDETEQNYRIIETGYILLFGALTKCATRVEKFDKENKKWVLLTETADLRCAQQIVKNEVDPSSEIVMLRQQHTKKKKPNEERNASLA